MGCRMGCMRRCRRGVGGGVEGVLRCRRRGGRGCRRRSSVYERGV